MYENIQYLKDQLKDRFGHIVNQRKLDEIAHLLDLAHDAGYDAGRNEGAMVAPDVHICEYDYNVIPGKGYCRGCKTLEIEAITWNPDDDMHMDCRGNHHVCGDGI